ncbi:MAG: hypothetical protein HY829_07375 [Actinobacteria bacterium]|nr:hypothetical protein [Actinomycetota bacterium]
MDNAPSAPARMGTPVEVQDAMTYLGLLGAWISQRRAELDELDAMILASPERAALTNDMMLSLSVWQAIKTRYDLLLATWDSGRVGPTERERLSALIWGRLDDSGPGTGSPTPGPAALSGLSVSLPEACRLSDALAGQLRARLNRSPQSDQLTARLRDLRAQVERLRDQARLEPAPTQPAVLSQVADISARAEDLASKSERGGDIGGLLGPLEIRAATMERDLIVGNTKRRQAQDKLARARELRSSLERREKELRALVAETVASVTPAPKYAVPNVEALGPVPSSVSQLDGYLGRLGSVSRAMQVVQDAYGKALGDRAALATRFGQEVGAAQGAGLADDPDIAALARVVESFLARRPTPTQVVASLLDAYAAAVRTIAAARTGGRA